MNRDDSRRPCRLLCRYCFPSAQAWAAIVKILLSSNPDIRAHALDVNAINIYDELQYEQI